MSLVQPEKYIQQAVILMENISVNRVIISRVLNKLGFRVVYPTPGIPLTTLINSENPVLIIRASHLTQEGGVDFDQAIKTFESVNNRSLPVIMIERKISHKSSDCTLDAENNQSIIIPLSNQNLIDVISRTISIQETAAPETGKTAEPVLPGDTATSSSRPAIMVVDDTPENLDFMKRVLLKKQLNVTLTDNGPAALAKLNGDSTCSLIFLDIQMPGMNGFEVIAAIRAQGHTLPVIAITALGNTEENKRCYIEAGFNKFIAKPATVEEIFGTIDEFLGDDKAFQNIQGKAA